MKKIEAIIKPFKLEEVKEALSGNLCRCGCYAGIAMAVRHAAEKIAARGGQA